MKSYGGSGSGRVVVRMARSLSSSSTPRGSDDLSTPSTDTPKYSWNVVSSQMSSTTPKSATSAAPSSSSSAKTPGGSKVSDGVHEVYWDDALCRMITRKIDTKGADNLSKALKTARDNVDEEEDDESDGYSSDSSGPAFKPSRRSVSWSLNRANTSYGSSAATTTSSDFTSSSSFSPFKNSSSSSSNNTEIEYFPPPPSSPSSPTAAVNVSLSSNEDNGDQSGENPAPAPTPIPTDMTTSDFFGSSSTHRSKKSKPKHPPKPAEVKIVDFTTTIATKKKKKSYKGTAKMNGRYSARVTVNAFDDIETPRPPLIPKKEESSDGGDCADPMENVSTAVAVVDDNTPATDIKTKSRKKGGYGRKKAADKGKTLSHYFSTNKPQQEDDALSSTSSTSSTSVLPTSLPAAASFLLSPPRTPAVSKTEEVKGRVTRALSLENAVKSDDIISESEGEEEVKEIKVEGEKKVEQEGTRKRGYGSGVGVTVTPKVSAFSTRRLDPTSRNGGSSGKQAGKKSKSKYFTNIEIPVLTNAVTPGAGKENSNSSSSSSGKKKRKGGYGKKRKSSVEEELERQRQYFKSLETQQLRTES